MNVNLDHLDAACVGLTAEESKALVDQLLGALSEAVDQDTWTRLTLDARYAVLRRAGTDATA